MLFVTNYTYTVKESLDKHYGIVKLTVLDEKHQ